MAGPLKAKMWPQIRPRIQSLEHGPRLLSGAKFCVSAAQSGAGPGWKQHKPKHCNRKLKVVIVDVFPFIHSSNFN